MSSPLLPLIVAAPVVTATVAVVVGTRERARDLTLVAGAVVTLGLVAVLVAAVHAGETVVATAPFELLPGVRPGLRADAFGTTFALLAAVLWVPASVYAVTYLREHHETSRTRFVAWYALCLSTAFGVAFAADLVTFLVFYELLTVATWPLVVHAGTDEARAAGRRYLATLLAGGAALVVGIAVVAQQGGDLSFRAGGMLAPGTSTATVAVVGGLFLLGFATKAAVMPLHRWLPAAMVAPTPVSALLHAVAVVKAGVFGIGRAVGFVVGPAALSAAHVTTVIAVATAVTIVVASVIAIREDRFKRRLAYSTIAHLSYIVLGFAIADRIATEGAVLHLVNHGVAKITLFFVAGAVMVHAHLDRVSQLDGLGRRMPWTFGAFTIGALSLTGLPPFGGLWSKLTLVRGAFDAGEAWAGVVMALGGVLTASYLLPIVHRAFFRPDSAEVAALPRGDAHPGLRVPLCVTAALVVLLGVADPAGLHRLAVDMATAVFGGGS